MQTRFGLGGGDGSRVSMSFDVQFDCFMRNVDYLFRTIYALLSSRNKCSDALVTLALESVFLSGCINLII